MALAGGRAAGVAGQDKGTGGRQVMVDGEARGGPAVAAMTAV